MISLPAAWSIDAAPMASKLLWLDSGRRNGGSFRKERRTTWNRANRRPHGRRKRRPVSFVRLVCPLDEIQYWFAVNGQRHFKTVAFYLMEAIGGDTSLHDGEYDEAAWFPLSEALGRLAFANEVEIVLMAARRSTLHLRIAGSRILAPRLLTISSNPSFNPRGIK